MEDREREYGQLIEEKKKDDPIAEKRGDLPSADAEDHDFEKDLPTETKKVFR